MNRRKFVKETVLTGSGIALGTSIIGCKFDEGKKESEIGTEIELANSENAVELTFQNTFVRQSLHTLDINSDIILAYRDAVKQMRSLPSPNELSWDFQANIHLQRCVHGNWLFLPWHRAYLYFFERICRKLSGLRTFALPYWDWTEFPQIPASFWGDDNPLFDRTRRINQTNTALLEFIGAETLKNVLDSDDFETFGSHRRRGTGELEGTPHNYIHRFVGGNMVTGLSPLDPIFWCHHANVDRIWAQWNNLGNKNPADNSWLNHSFNDHFFDENENQVSMAVSELDSTRKLNYTYESDSLILQSPIVETALLPTENIFLASTTTFNQTQNWIENPIELTKEKMAVLDEIVRRKPENAKTIKLKLKGIKPPQNEDFFVRIFINCPYLTKDTPINDPNYVGSFTFFGTDHDGHKMSGMELEYIFDITKKYENLSKNNSFVREEMNVQLIPVPFDKNSEIEYNIEPKEVEIVIT